jgi:glycosyltransferase involved in cell wall biosynthesis
VVGFDTGSLSEIVKGDAGRVVPYGADHWKLKKPDTSSLANATAEVLDEQDRFRTLARARAESVFDVEKMVDEYLKILLI